MEHSDVFLSYRRKDVDFAKKIDEALKATGREVWVDWEDIPPGVEGFSDEIQRGIEGSNAMVAILSPSYIESEYCLMELREALKLKKRVIPVVLQKFDPTPPPEGIGHINWVYFTPHAGQDNPFDESFKKVIQALEADYDHSREHTRLLLRAIEWDKRARNPSYVLKGAEIEKAEGWQLAATAKDPSPTSLQGEYILTSRKIQRRQQQRFMGVIGVLLVVAAIAAVFALLQAQEAERQRGVALDALAQARVNAEIAHSLALSSAALQSGNEEIAEALALEATRSENAPADVFKVLEEISYQPGSIRYARVPGSDDGYLQIRYPAVASEGRAVVVGNHRYDLADRSVNVVFTDVPGIMLSSVYLPDGKRVILSGDDNAAQDPSAHPTFMGLYDSETGSLIHAFDTGIGVADILLSQDGKTVVSYLPGGKAVWWDVESGDKLREFEVPVISAFSPDLKWLARASYNTETSAYELIMSHIDADTETMAYTIPIQVASPMRFSPDSTRLAIMSAVPVIYDVARGEQTLSLIGLSGIVRSFRFSPDGLTMVGTSDGDVVVWTYTGAILTRFTAHGVTMLYADFVRNGEGIVSIDVPGTILEWDLRPGNLIKYTPLTTTVTAANLTADGKSLLLAEGCDIITRDSVTLDETDRVSLPADQPCSPLMFVDPNGGDNKVFRNYSTYDDKGETAVLEVMSMATGKTLQSWTIPLIGQFVKAWFMPDGERMLMAYFTRAEDPNDYIQTAHLDIRDIASGEILRTYENIPLDANMALSPDGTRLLYSQTIYNEEGGPTHKVAMIDLATGEETLRLAEQSGNVWFTPDGTRFLTIKPTSASAQNYQLQLWDAETGAFIRTVSGKMALPQQLVFSADGSSVFTFRPRPFGVMSDAVGLTPSGIESAMGYTNTSEYLFLQWDLNTGSLIRSFPIEPWMVLPSPDGTRLITVTTTMIRMASDVYEWRLDTPDTLIAFVCDNRYVPSFTPEQRQNFLINSETSVCVGR